MRQATASAKLLDPILQIARHLQQDPHHLLEALGIDASRVEQPGARIPASLFSALLDELARRTDNPMIALRTGEATQPRMLGSVGFVISTAARLGDAFRRLSHYLPLLIEGVHLSLHAQEEQIELGIELEEEDQRSLAEWLMACLYNWPRWLTGHHLPLERVEFSFPTPEHPQRYEQFFAAEVSFGAPRTRFWFHARQLDRPCLDANEELQRHHQSFADQLLSHAGRDGALIARIKSRIRTLLEQGERCDRQQMANHLAMSLRTMQRKLDQQQTSFQALFDSTRQEMALQLIQRDQHSFGEISYQLGFSSLSAFQKAFKRWTGQAPGQWREQHRPDPMILRSEQPRTLAELGQQGIAEEAFYPLAIQLLQRLQQHQAQQLPAPSLHPSQVSVHFDDNGTAHLHLQQPAKLPLSLVESLPFCPPESGRLLPYRTDDRSLTFRLGCLFFYLLHGLPPFSGRDSATTLIAQLQQSPSINEQLSPPLQQLLIRLLARPLEDRYQQLSALLHDLQQLHNAHLEKQPLNHFQIAALDRPDFRTPPALYEREDAIAQLTQALHSCQRGEAQGLLIEGSPGAGRRALIDQLRQLAWRAQVSLIDTDQAELSLRDGCHALATQLLRQKLVLPPAQRQIAAQRIRRRLGRQLSSAAGWLPELGALLELPDSTPNADPVDQTTASQLLCTLLSCHPAPLVIVLENIDAAHREWMALWSAITQLNPTHHLHVITRPRTPAERTALTVPDRITTRIHLRPLTHQGLQQWLTDLFTDQQPDQRTLVDWLQKQSGGNPGKLVAALESMRQRGWLHYRKPHWQWRSAASEAVPDPQLRSLLSHSYHNQPLATQQMLQWAAVAGDPFSPRWLADARQDPLQRIEIHLWPALQAGLLRQSQSDTERLRFSHPDLDQPILAEIPPALRSEMAWQLGQTLRRHWQQQPSSSLLQRCTDLLNSAHASRARRILRRPLSRLNQQAAEDAAANGHLQLALNRMQSALTLSPREIPLHLNAVTLALQANRLEQAEPWLSAAEQLEASVTEQLRRVKLRAELLAAQQQPDAAIVHLKAALAEHGCPLPDSARAQHQRLTTETKADVDLLPLLALLAELAEELGLPGLAYQTLLLIDNASAAQISRHYFVHAGYRPTPKLSPLPPLPPSASAIQLSLQLRGSGWLQSRRMEIDQLQALSQTAAHRTRNVADAYARWLRALGGEPLPAVLASTEEPLDTAIEHSAGQQALHRLQQALSNATVENPEHAPPPPSSPWEELACFCADWLQSQPTARMTLLNQINHLLDRFDGTTLALDIMLIAGLRLAQLTPLTPRREAPLLARTLTTLAMRWQLQTGNAERFKAGGRFLTTLVADVASAAPDPLDLAQTQSMQNTVSAPATYEQLLNALTPEDRLLRRLILESYARHCRHLGADYLSQLLFNEAASGWRQWGATGYANQLQLAVGSTAQAG